MTQFLVKLKICVQVSPDDFEMQSIEKLFNEETKLSTVKEWVISHKWLSKNTKEYKRMTEISLSEPEI